MAISSEMNKQPLGQTDGRSRRQTRRGTAFLIEALVVLAFLMMSLAVFVQLFSSAQLEGLHANRVSQAVIAATNCAERFSADPTGVARNTTADGLEVTCDVASTQHAGGILYEATIVVRDSTDADEELYTLQTSRYVSDAQGGDDA